MIEELKNARRPEAAPAGPLRRFGWLVAKLVAAFLFISVAQVVIFKFVPIPFTLTMAMDEHSVTKDWTPLDRIDRDMVAAGHRMLTEGLGVNHLRLVMGTPMGGMHTWLWGELHPDFMDALMPLASNVRTF